MSNNQSKTAEPLSAIESLLDMRNARYERLENAIEHSNLAEIQAYYASLHGMLPQDVAEDQRFHGHPEYTYGDASKCCEDCEDLEMAIAVNISSMECRLAEWFPAIAKASHPGN